MTRQLNALEKLMGDARRDIERTFIGADRIFDGFVNSFGCFDNYPPYNIEKLGDDKYRITLALAGFNKKDIEITKEGDFLTITGNIKTKEKSEEFLHHGIANRDFTRKVQLASDLEIGDATMENGLLHIELNRIIPEEKKPRTIEINVPVAAKPGRQTIKDKK